MQIIKFYPKKKKKKKISNVGFKKNKNKIKTF